MDTHYLMFLTPALDQNSPVFGPFTGLQITGCTMRDGDGQVLATYDTFHSLWYPGVDLQRELRTGYSDIVISTTA